MTAVEFFTALRADVDANQSIPDFHPTQYYKSVKGALLSHIDTLIMLAGQTPENQKMNRSMIRSSWGMVREYGREYGIFKRFEGDEETRKALLEFVNQP